MCVTTQKQDRGAFCFIMDTRMQEDTSTCVQEDDIIAVPGPHTAIEEGSDPCDDPDLRNHRDYCEDDDICNRCGRFGCSSSSSTTSTTGTNLWTTLAATTATSDGMDLIPNMDTGCRHPDYRKHMGYLPEGDMCTSCFQGVCIEMLNDYRRRYFDDNPSDTSQVMEEDEDGIDTHVPQQIVLLPSSRMTFSIPIQPPRRIWISPEDSCSIIEAHVLGPWHCVSLLNERTQILGLPPIELHGSSMSAMDCARLMQTTKLGRLMGYTSRCTLFGCSRPWHYFVEVICRSCDTNHIHIYCAKHTRSMIGY